MIRRFSPPRNALCLLLIAAALMMRAMLPGGYMLDQNRAGDVVVSLCNSDIQLVIPMKDDAPASDEGGRDQPCAFASLADSATPPDPMARPALPHLAQAAYDATRARAMAPALRHDLPPATGPPLTV